MFISKKKHNQIVKEVIMERAQAYEQRLASKDKEIEQGHKLHLKIVAELEKELEEARNLKLILEKLYPLHSIDGSILRSNGAGFELNLPDNVLVYTEDILGGKVIKQEGTKCLVIDSRGDVKTGLTKKKADKGYSYKLVRN